MIILTEKAYSQIKRALARRGAGSGIRVGVNTTGCSGLAYQLTYSDTMLPEDHVQYHDGFYVVIDPKSIPFINGMTIDYSQKGLNTGFDFINPLETGRCGCGESFRV